ncbi:protein FAM169B isoform X2 [Megalops cyprinoides]|uniref:protein FAM169B isoform X2 n=1 Tax=Megalops cyprinoides TaxID=118141 RepID=UPI00186414D7|nr:protein FAM169B isoform X2 [Megalops cyprinoides]
METTLKCFPFPEKYPVDVSPLDYNDLRKSSDDYMAYLAGNSSSESNWFPLPGGAKVEVRHTSVKRLPLFGDGDPLHTVLALSEPGCETQVVALYLNGKWWAVNDILKTSNTSRSGLVTVQSVGERVVLFLLSQIIFGVLERPLGADTYFTPHPLGEVGKILWQDGEAAGFYTIKQKGALCGSCTSRSYLLPVLDTVFVRMQFRRRGLALRMLGDFCASFTNEEVVGISSPVSPSMQHVCRKYLLAREQERERLYEVEAPGGWAQRRNIWLSIQLGQHPANHSNIEKNLSDENHEQKSDADEAEKVRECQTSDRVEAAAREPKRRTSLKRAGDASEKSVKSKQVKALN